MSKASDKLLGELHGKLAKSMLAALRASENASELLEEYGEELPADVVSFLSKTAGTNPSLLTAITKFLKDNDITCSSEDNGEMSEREERLKKKSERKSVSNIVSFE